MDSTANGAIEKYLKRLDAELLDVPGARRREIVDEIAEHIGEARADLPAETDADIRTLLERLGDPADIAAEARRRFDVRPARPGWQETAALVFLLVGGFVFFFGWFIGLVLLWSSAVWTRRDKVLGALVVPGGLALPLFMLTTWLAFGGSARMCAGTTDLQTGRTINETCTGGGLSASAVLTLVLILVLLVAPLFTTAYLARRMRRGLEPATV